MAEQGPGAVDLRQTYEAPTPRWLKAALVLAAAVAFALPIVAYWWSIGRAPSILPEEARRRLASQPGAATLVDIRAPSSFARRHVPEAENWPFREIQRLASAGDVPPRFRERTLFLLCPNGAMSAEAALHLRSLGVERVYGVDGGMIRWIASLADEAAGSAPPPSDPYWREASLHQQVLAVATGYVIRPAYMLIALVLIVWLWRRPAPDLTALRWGLAALLLGESACAANVILFRHHSHLAEYLHSFGMVLCFALVAYALLEGLDRRLVRFSDPGQHCVALSLCGPCAKHDDVPCGLRRLFLLLTPCLMVLSLMPLAVVPGAASYNTTIFGVPYNYSHAVIYQVFELRVAPLYALVLLGAALLALLLRPRAGVALAKPLLAAGVGSLSFALLRLLVFGVYARDLVWSQLWEEVLEFLLVAGSAWLLWTFRARLLAPDGSAAQ